MKKIISIALVMMMLLSVFATNTVFAAVETRAIDSEGSKNHVMQSGYWGSDASSECNEGSQLWSNVKDSVLSFSFSGTYIKWTGQKTHGGGDVDVYIDQVKVDTVSYKTDISNESRQQVIYEKNDLSNEEHLLEIKVVGNGYTYVDVFYVDAASPDIPFSDPLLKGPNGLKLKYVDSEDDELIENEIFLSGAWMSDISDQCYAGSQFWVNGAENAIEYNFIGTYIKIIGQKSCEGGDLDIYIDGEHLETVSYKSTNESRKQVIYENSSLSEGAHYVEVIALGTGYVYVDAFIVEANPKVPEQTPTPAPTEAPTSAPTEAPTATPMGVPASPTPTSSQKLVESKGMPVIAIVGIVFACLAVVAVVVILVVKKVKKK